MPAVYRRTGSSLGGTESTQFIATPQGFEAADVSIGTLIMVDELCDRCDRAPPAGAWFAPRESMPAVRLNVPACNFT
jgi:hypothetical protein